MSLIADPATDDNGRLAAAKSLTVAILRDRLWWKARLNRPIHYWDSGERLRPDFVSGTYEEWRVEVEAANRLLRKHEMGKHAAIKNRTVDEYTAIRSHIQGLQRKVEQQAVELRRLQETLAFEWVLAGNDIDGLGD